MSRQSAHTFRKITSQNAAPTAANPVTVNVDLLTEMDRGVAEGYIDHALAKSKALFSINHEVNSFTVNEIIRSRGPVAKILRNGSPIRSGHIEEISSSAEIS
ncbi:hypothetical protein [Ensifer sp. ENS12]|uniref:hypothetical protein n=1 Tax=Ensifer sp. ENS12 TaxID=2854774 RepID=UPI001C490ED2|nr:hypothetical protein [Ensifer sp. ENS12]MBV7522606.1 hypothetical protein [Ensifer sp. ENS12]